MDKKVLVIAYALSQEVGVLEVVNAVEECKKEWLRNLNWIDRAKVKVNKRFYEKEVVLINTGIGKVNAYSNLCRILEDAQEYLGKNAKISVLNIGTAASINARIGEVVECSRFMDLDLLKVGYGDSSEYTIYNVLDHPRYLYKLSGPQMEIGNYSMDKRYSCNSGDMFVTEPDDAHQMRDGWTAVCGMEGFALARAVEDTNTRFGTDISFRCVKYITDKIGEDNTLEGWEEELPAAQMALTNVALEAVKEFYSEK